jgi:hypothetical protein
MGKITAVWILSFFFKQCSSSQGRADKIWSLCQNLKWGPILLKEKLMKNIMCYLCILKITCILIFKHYILTSLGISYMLVANGLRSCGDKKLRSKFVRPKRSSSMKYRIC